MAREVNGIFIIECFSCLLPALLCKIICWESSGSSGMSKVGGQWRRFGIAFTERRKSSWPEKQWIKFETVFAGSVDTSLRIGNNEFTISNNK